MAACARELREPSDCARSRFCFADEGGRRLRGSVWDALAGGWCLVLS